MKKKLIPVIAMVLIAAACIGLVVALNPAPKFTVDDGGTPVVMTINGEEIHAREYASMMIYSKSYMDNMFAMYGMDSTIWDDPSMRDGLIAQLEDQTRQQIVYIHTIIEQFNKAGLSLDRDVIQQMETQKASVIEQQGGQDMFDIWLMTLGFDEQMYDNILLVSAYVEALSDYYFGENGKNLPPQAEMQQYFADNYLQAKHILIQTTDANYEPLTGDALEEKRQLAEDVLARAREGEDFDTLIAEYNEDPGMSMSPEGYILDKEGNTASGAMVEEFTAGCWSVGVDEIADLVETSYGYHIIKRVPLDETRLSEFSTQIASAITGSTVSFDALIQEWIAAADVQTTDEIKNVTLETVFAYALPSNASGTGDAPDAPDAGNTPDGGDAPDAGEPSGEGNAPDAGNTPDAGDAPDAGNTPDAGNAPDAGNTPDAGDAPDAGAQ